MESQGEGALASPETSKEITNNGSHTVKGGAAPAKAVVVGRDPIPMLGHVFNPPLNKPFKKLAKGGRKRNWSKLPCTGLRDENDQCVPP